MTDRGRFGRLLARFTGQWHLERLASVEEKVGKFGRAQREELAAQRQRLDEMSAVLETRASADALGKIQRRLEDVHISLAQQDRAFSETLERARVLDEQGVDDRRLARRVEEFLRHDRPVIVGPWTGEVGFELLYWVPFVRRMVAAYGIPAERLLVVSRGGVASWYGGLATRYADVFSFFSTDEFRQATEAKKKQRLVGAFDSEVVKRVVAAHSLGRVDLLHPGMMYRLFMPVWKDLATLSRVEKYADYGSVEAADVSVPPEFPRPTWRHVSTSASAFRILQRTGHSSHRPSTQSASTRRSSCSIRRSLWTTIATSMRPVAACSGSGSVT